MSALEFVNKKGIKQVSDKSEIVNLINSVLQENPQMVNEYRNGKKKVFGFLCGPNYENFKRVNNPQIVNQVLKELLNNN